MRRLLLVVATAIGVLFAGERTGAAETGGIGTDRTKLIMTEGPAAADERETLVLALRLLPALPARVAVLDAGQARPDVKPTLLRLDAFVVRGRPEVYVVRQSGLLQCAIRREPLCTHALAAAIWHEMAHIDGADEPEARRREEAQWTAFIRDQQVDPIAALRFLSALVKRPDDRLLTDDGTSRARTGRAALSDRAVVRCCMTQIRAPSSRERGLPSEVRKRVHPK